MFVSTELSLPGESFQRCLFQDATGVIVEIIEQLAVEHVVPAVDVRPLLAGLLGERCDAVPVHFQVAELGRREDPGERCNLTVLAMESDQVVHVEIDHAVAVGQHEFGVVSKVFLNPLHACAGHGVLAGVGDRHPGAKVALSVDCFFRFVFGREIDGEIVRIQLGVGEELLDHFRFVTGGEDEVGMPVVRVAAHDVPENGERPDRDHRLRQEVGGFAEPRPVAAGEDDHFHVRLLPGAFPLSLKGRGELHRNPSMHVVHDPVERGQVQRFHDAHIVERHVQVLLGEAAKFAAGEPRTAERF